MCFPPTAPFVKAPHSCTEQKTDFISLVYENLVVLMPRWRLCQKRSSLWTPHTVSHERPLSNETCSGLNAHRTAHSRDPAHSWAFVLESAFHVPNPSLFQPGFCRETSWEGFLSRTVFFHGELYVKKRNHSLCLLSLRASSEGRLFMKYWKVRCSLPWQGKMWPPVWRCSGQTDDPWRGLWNPATWTKLWRSITLNMRRKWPRLLRLRYTPCLPSLCVLFLERCNCCCHLMRFLSCSVDQDLKSMKMAVAQVRFSVKYRHTKQEVWSLCITFSFPEPCLCFSSLIPWATSRPQIETSAHSFRPSVPTSDPSAQTPTVASSAVQTRGVTKDSSLMMRVRHV